MILQLSRTFVHKRVSVLGSHFPYSIPPNISFTVLLLPPKMFHFLANSQLGPPCKPVAFSMHKALLQDKQSCNKT